jgi:hypothetical protein
MSPHPPLAQALIEAEAGHGPLARPGEPDGKLRSAAIDASGFSLADAVPRSKVRYAIWSAVWPWVGRSCSATSRLQ